MAKKRKKKPAYPPKRRAKEPKVLKAKDIRPEKDKFRRELNNGTHETILKETKYV